MKDNRLLRDYGSRIDLCLKLKLSWTIIYFCNLIVWEWFPTPLFGHGYNPKILNFVATTIESMVCGNIHTQVRCETAKAWEFQTCKCLIVCAYPLIPHILNLKNGGQTIILCGESHPWMPLYMWKLLRTNLSG